MCRTIFVITISVAFAIVIVIGGCAFVFGIKGAFPGVAELFQFGQMGV